MNTIILMMCDGGFNCCKKCYIIPERHRSEGGGKNIDRGRAKEGGNFKMNRGMHGVEEEFAIRIELKLMDKFLE